VSLESVKDQVVKFLVCQMPSKKSWQHFTTNFGIFDLRSSQPPTTNLPDLSTLCAISRIAPETRNNAHPKSRPQEDPRGKLYRLRLSQLKLTISAVPLPRGRTRGQEGLQPSEARRHRHQEPLRSSPPLSHIPNLTNPRSSKPANPSPRVATSRRSSAGNTITTP
jgi:hypothetical protein